MPEEITHPQLSAPNHKLGDYRAWDIDDCAQTPADMIWISKARDVDPLPHLILPHGEPSIAIRRRCGADGALRHIDVVICGPYGKARWYRPEAGEELIAIRLKPEMSANVFGIKAGEFLDADPVSRITMPAGVCPNALHAAETCDALSVAQTLFRELMAHKQRDDHHKTPEVIAASLIRKSEGRTGVRQLANHLEISERHLRRRFRAATGMSPKTYARQMRVTTAALRADASETPDWAAIATDSGYYDQAHMISEFHDLCGQTPVATHGSRRKLRTQDRSVFSNTSLPEHS